MKDLPTHLAIIPDGNRRWARKKGLPVYQGHKKGVENFRRIAEFARQKGIEILTFYAFSSENWKRAKSEINYLMELFEEAVDKSIEKLNEQKVKLQIIGNRSKLPPAVIKALEKGERITQDNKQGILNIALSYGGREEILEATKKMLKKGVGPEALTEEKFKQNLWTKDIKDPDLIVRTGKEKRLSNFLLWQGAYSELYFSEKYWPEFSPQDLDKALVEYSERQRRFGR